MDVNEIQDVMAVLGAASKVVADVRARVKAAKADGKVSAAELASIVEAELATLAPSILALVKDLVG